MPEALRQIEAASAGDGSATPQASGPHSWYGPRDLVAVFGPGPSAQKARLRLVDRTPAHQKQLRRDGWYLRDDVEVLGRPLAELCQVAGVFKPPPGYGSYAESERRTWRALVGRELRFRDFCSTQGLPRSAPETYAEFGRVYADWLKAHELTADRESMYRARRRLVNRDEVPRRGRPKGSGKREWDSRAVTYFEQLTFHSHAEVPEIFRALRSLGFKEHFAAPTLGMVRARFNEIPKAALVLARKGERALDALAPAGVRPARALRGWWSLDVRTDDVRVQVPGPRGVPRVARAACSGVYAPFHQQWLVMLYDVTGHTELITKSLRAAIMKFGAPRVLQTDNGSEYKFLVEDEVMGGFLRQCGTRVVQAEPYRPQSKPIEGAWNDAKDQRDRWCRSFCGGSPPEKPEDLDRWAKTHVTELPTLADYARWSELFIETHNATGKTGLGDLPPNVHAELYGPPRRMIDRDVIDLWLTAIVKEGGKPARRLVRDDGVTISSILYRPSEPDLARLQGRTVLLRRDPELADRIILCDERGAPLAHAYNEKLAGSRREHAREAVRRRARFKRAVKAYVPARNDALQCDTGRILAAKRDYALAEERRLRAQLGEIPERPVRLIRTDLVESAKALKARERPRSVEGLQHKTPSAASMEAGRDDGFEALARRQDDGRPASRVTCSWDTYPEHNDDAGVPSQDARDAFDQLADVG